MTKGSMAAHLFRPREEYRKPKVPHVAPERAYTNATQREVYKPSDDRTYYRNDGHKSIKSRGQGC